MERTLLANEATLVGCAFWLTLAFVASWEGIAPRRALTASLRVRWVSNLGIWLIGNLAARWAFPLLGVAFAVYVADRDWGLFRLLSLPSWLAVAISFPALDLFRYGKHRLYHRLRPLWRLHRVHHTDMDCDVTAGVRFHPIEGLADAAATLAMIAALGVPPVAVLVDQLLSLVSGFFTHGNVRIPARWESLLRLVFVTPEMHRVHHSALARETDSNFSTLYSWWDRLFGTYVAQPAGGHDRMTLGLEQFRDRKYLWLPWMLVQPFLRR
jgi:sterol desaturase/sphingolipid hydroxylase (fatty acid hydroxylase superfamily)